MQINGCVPLNNNFFPLEFRPPLFLIHCYDLWRSTFGVSVVRIKRQENMCGKFWKQSRLGPFSYLTGGNYNKVIKYSFFFFLSEVFFTKQVQSENSSLLFKPEIYFLSFCKSTWSLWWSPNPNQEKNSSYLLRSLLSLCSSQKWIPVPLGLSFTGRSDLALPLSTRRVVLPGLSHQ